MAVSVRTVPATRGHAQDLARCMRAADAAEVKASGNYTPLGALMDALSFSSHAYATFFGDDVAALWGAGPDAAQPGVGAAWALTSAVVDRHPKAFLRASREGLTTLLRHYPVLTNAIDARYGGALRWAAWLGGVVEDAEPHGPHALPFCHVTFFRGPRV